MLKHTVTHLQPYIPEKPWQIWRKNAHCRILLECQQTKILLALVTRYKQQSKTGTSPKAVTILMAMLAVYDQRSQLNWASLKANLYLVMVWMKSLSSLPVLF